MGESCASDELCDEALLQGMDQCAAPVCERGSMGCFSDPDRLRSWVCNDEQTRQIPKPCEENHQCSPGAGCITLDIDPVEVSIQSYVLFAQEQGELGAPPGELGLFGDEAEVCAGTDVTAIDDDACLIPEPDKDLGSLEKCKGCIACAATASCPPACDAECNYELPMVCVTWCQAMAYCRSLDQRLCGGLGSRGALDEAAPYDDLRSETSQGSSAWSNACAAADDWKPSLFSTGSRLGDDCAYGESARPSREEGDCRSANAGYSHLYDLSGNVAEWEDSCEQAKAADSACRVRGGSFMSSRSRLNCAVLETRPRDRAFPDVGFRCCSVGDSGSENK